MGNYQDKEHMMFVTKNLCVLAYANGFTVWHYKTPDLFAAVTDLGYFNDAHDMVRVGDMVFTNTGNRSVTLEVRAVHHGDVTVGVWGE